MQTNELKEKIQQLLADPLYRPSRQSEIVKRLKVAPEQRNEVQRVLSQLINEGKIVRIRKDRLILPSEADLVTGRLHMNERGFGFVIPEDKTRKTGDIFVAAENIGVAMHNDLVVCRLSTPTDRLRERERRGRQRRDEKGARPEGRIIRILKRANETIVGTLQKTPNFHFVVPDEPRIIQDIYVTMNAKERQALKARIGDKVVVKLDPWLSRHVNPEGKIIEVLGHPDDPHIDIISVIRKFRLPVEFPKGVIEETGSLPEEVRKEDTEGRLDLTKTLTVTIDPEDARDFDDAISVSPLKNGGWSVGVHIADVSHYVRPGTELDHEARVRGNSVYLPDRVIPMLPEKLSNGLCSLKPHVIRLTKSVLFELDAKGSVVKYSFADSFIHSAHRYSYPEALAVLENPNDTSEEGRMLHEAWKAASKIRHLRFENGSLDLDFPEVKVICDDKGRAVRLEKREYDISHQLIEEYMLLANEAVAEATQRGTVPSLYRVHEEPDAEKLEEYREFVQTYGFKIGDITNRRELQKLLKMFRGQPEEYVLKLNLLKSLKRAAYEEHPKGHFGLAKENYTHFTSPIRRYADLVVHRVLVKLTKSKGKAPYSMNELAAIADHVSTTERIADDAENEATKLKQIEYFERQLKSEKRDSFPAVITEVRNYGLFIELPDFLLSGLVHISTLEDDFYRFDATNFQIIGKESKRIYKTGQRIQVEPTRVDRFKRQIDFRIVKPEA